MLVLSRKVGEKIVIGDNITVEVLKVSGNRVTIGLRAPAEVSIMRGELNKSSAIKPISTELIVEDGLLVAV